MDLRTVHRTVSYFIVRKRAPYSNTVVFYYTGEENVRRYYTNGGAFVTYKYSTNVLKICTYVPYMDTIVQTKPRTYARTKNPDPYLVVPYDVTDKK